ncbi:MAG: YqaE/Pmp3 family membrane protein [Crocinitomicaceae bacterium]|nr:YqaE/Pmp3 family membrane protein [Crocinitomicaceae bacterium]
MTLLAILLPWLSFFLRGKIFAGIICLILQITIFGWLPAVVWALISLSNERADKRTERIIKAQSK